MSNPKKRVYNSENRDAQAAQTRSRVLVGAQELFKTHGFDGVTIDMLAKAAAVSAPTIYSLFQSKRGVLLALLSNAYPVEQFDALVTAMRQEKSVKARLAISAKIARQINDAIRAQLEIFVSASGLAPEFKKLEKEKERLRYIKQEETILRMAKENTLSKKLSIESARSVLWAFTGRDMYRMFVIEQQWSSDEYEKWLAETLVKLLTDGC